MRGTESGFVSQDTQCPPWVFIQSSAAQVPVTKASIGTQAIVSWSFPGCRTRRPLGYRVREVTCDPSWPLQKLSEGH